MEPGPNPREFFHRDFALSPAGQFGREFENLRRLPTTMYPSILLQGYRRISFLLLPALRPFGSRTALPRVWTSTREPVRATEGAYPVQSQHESPPLIALEITDRRTFRKVIYRCPKRDICLALEVGVEAKQIVVYGVFTWPESQPEVKSDILHLSSAHPRLHPRLKTPRRCPCRANPCIVRAMLSG